MGPLMTSMLAWDERLPAWGSFPMSRQTAWAHSETAIQKHNPHAFCFIIHVWLNVHEPKHFCSFTLTLCVFTEFRCTYLNEQLVKIYLHIGKEQFTGLGKIPSDSQLGVLVPQKGLVQLPGVLRLKRRATNLCACIHVLSQLLAPEHELASRQISESMV